MTHSDDVIIADKISPKLFYALFMALPSNIMTADISGYNMARSTYSLERHATMTWISCHLGMVYYG